MWPSASEPLAGVFVRSSVERTSQDVRNVVLVPRLVLPGLHRRIWGKGAQGWQTQHEAPARPHRLLEYRTVRIPKVGEGAARAAGIAYALRSAGERPDIVHAHFLLGPAPAAVRVARRRGIPSIITAHGSDVRFLESGLSRRSAAQVRDACAQATRILAVSSDLAARLERAGIDVAKVDVLSMGVDERVFLLGDRDEMRAELGVDRDALVVLFVGRFTHEKGAVVLRDAIRRLGKDVRGFVAGPTEVDPAPLCALGNLSQTEVARWLIASDVLCLPSFAEGMPVSIMEALASGTPVVASDVGGIPEQVKPGQNGFLVAPGEVETLTLALTDALNARWSPDAIRSTSEPFWWSNISTRLAAIYHEILEGRS